MQIHLTELTCLLALSSFLPARCDSPSNPPVIRQANEVAWNNGYAEFVSDPDVIPVIGLRVAYKTLILFPGDERIVRVEVGVRGSALEIKYGQNWVTLRPSFEKLATNLHVATDQGRVYTFDLLEGYRKEPHKKVLVLRPDMDQDGGDPLGPLPPASGRGQSPSPSGAVKTSSGRSVTVDDLGGQPPAVAASATPAASAGKPANAGSAQPAGLPTTPGLPLSPDQAKALGVPTPINPNMQPVPGVPGAELVRRLDKDYRITNQKAKLCEVESVFNDGQRTFVVFRSPILEAPLFYRVNDGGKRELLNYRIEPAKDPRDKDIFMIPRVVDAGVVKVGDAESVFTWRKVRS